MSLDSEKTIKMHGEGRHGSIVKHDRKNCDKKQSLPCFRTILAQKSSIFFVPNGTLYGLGVKSLLDINPNYT